MEIIVDYFESFEAFLTECNSKDKEYFIMAGSQCVINAEQLNQTSLKITGAFFPEVIFNNRLYSRGLIAVEINADMQLYLEKTIETINFSKMVLQDAPTVLSIVDGTSSSNELYLNELFKHVGLQTNILGAGAGSLDISNKKVFFDNEGFYHNCALIIVLQNHVDLGVKHGWDFLEGPFVVTSSYDNILKEIDYKNAYEVYKSVVEKDYGEALDDETFLKISHNYPLGIMKYQGEQIVRDVCEINNKELTLIGNITENTVINILKGDKTALLNATKEASQDALKNGCEFILMFDCLTRKNFLEDKFEEELDIIYSQNKSFHVVGAISIGEIANNGKHYINFLNKTCVIGGICF